VIGRREGSRRRGFSLPELLVVMAVGSMIAAISFPEMSRMLRKSRAVEAAGRIESVLRLAREKSLARRVHYRLTLDPDSRRYVVEYEESPGTWVADFDSPVQLPDGVGFDAVLGDGSGGLELIVEPRGTIDFEDAPARITVYNEKGDSIAIEMVRTGRVRSWQL
jgi:prepilin-type N-terminal cleavage/methylation domain-containing protein